MQPRPRAETGTFEGPSVRCGSAMAHSGVNRQGYGKVGW